MYNIYPIGFAGAPKENDGNVVYRLDKIYDWIDNFKRLQVDTLVLNPVFESSSHGYDTIDYCKIDCRLGDNNSFKKICETLHKNGIRIIVDGVFNHVGRDFFAFKDVQKNRENSHYCSWFENLHFNGNTHFNDGFWYEGWAGHFELVKLNLKNPEVVKHLLDAVSFWIDEFQIDGLRLDAADCIDLDFFKKLRQLCKGKKSDFWLYGEITHGDYNHWANTETLDSVTNYECYKGLYSSHNDHNYFEIAHSLNRQFGDGGIYKDIYTFNFVDNHDVNRISSMMKNNLHLNNVHTILYTMPGVPCIYYGSEWAIKGERTRHSDYELRPCLDLGAIEQPNNELYYHLCKLGKIRHNIEALKYGNFKNLCIKNEQLVYAREYNNQKVYVALNLSQNCVNVDFKVDGKFVLTDILNDNEKFNIENWATIPMQPYSSRILVQNDGNFEIDLSQDYNFVKTEQSEQPQNQNKRETTVIPVRKGKYRHYKGNEYEVMFVAKDSETLEEVVVYRALYGNNEFWVRPRNMFEEIIEVQGKKQRRFEPLD